MPSEHLAKGGFPFLRELLSTLCYDELTCSKHFISPPLESFPGEGLLRLLSENCDGRLAVVTDGFGSLLTFGGHEAIMATRKLNSAVARWSSYPSLYGSAQCHRALASMGDVHQAASRRFLGKKRRVTELWRDLFANTSEWCDHRPDKMHPRFPDFKHKQTGESLWLVDSRNPSWVQAEVAAIPPGRLQSNSFSWNQRLKRYAKAGQYAKTLEVFNEMQQEGIRSDPWTFLPVLNACAGLGALEEGKHVHTKIIQDGCESNVFVTTCLVDMYAKCGSIEDARRVFNRAPILDVVTWNAMIGGYVKTGQGPKAIELFRRMCQEGVVPNASTFVGVLNACASVGAFEEGRWVHEQIIRMGCQSDVFVSSSLVDMYAKCGSIEDAQRVFSVMPDRDVVAWSAMISGYVKSGEGMKAMNLFRDMQQEGVEPDAVTFVGVLTACSSVGALEEGRSVHEQIIHWGCESNIFVGNSLIDMYAKCGSIEDARRIFDNLPVRDVISWNAMIGGYVKSGEALEAIKLYREMPREGVEPNAVTFVGMLSACANLAALEEGVSVHEEIIQEGWESNIFVGSCLIDMYARCGSIEDARSVFNKMPRRSVATWNAMIGGYAMHGVAEEAIALFEYMHKEGVEMDEITFTCLLSACSHGGLVKEGLWYFKSMSSQFNILPTSEHCACMVDLLGRAGRLEEAEELANRMPFEAGASAWRSLLGACGIHGNIEIAERAARRCLEFDPESASGDWRLSKVYDVAEKWDTAAAIERETGRRDCESTRSHLDRGG